MPDGADQVWGCGGGGGGGGGGVVGVGGIHHLASLRLIQR